MKFINYFSIQEKILWLVSITIICGFSFILENNNIIIVLAAIIGTTSLILSAKAHPFGPLLMIFFSLLYGYISYELNFYGEMFTYLGMSLPMSLVAFINWTKNPNSNKSKEVKINHLEKKDWMLMFYLAFIITIIFFFILRYLNTPILTISTISVTTSFMAVYLTAKRSEYYALGYALNDLILITIWTYASMLDSSYILFVITFSILFINDIYGFYNWSKLKKQQKKKS